MDKDQMVKSCGTIALAKSDIENAKLSAQYLHWNVRYQQKIAFTLTNIFKIIMVAILWDKILCRNGGRVLADLFGLLLLDPLVGGLEVVSHLGVDGLVNLLLRKCFFEICCLHSCFKDEMIRGKFLHAASMIR